MAYDFETTRIKKGTPDPVYLTAYAADWKISVKITDWQNLCDILETQFLTDDNNKASFVAWNGNQYDAYFIARALLLSDKYILRPYLAGGKSLRGLKVIDKDRKGFYWEFLDGISMTGMQGKKLKDFVATFAPQYPKLDLDFDNVEFNPNDSEHIKYADRDSEALYFGIQRANEIVNKLTGHDLQTTIGNLAIKFFEQSIPEGKLIWRVPQEVYEILHGAVKRGGYCWTQKKYIGPVWKYDLNQAYAAAMRDCKLPAQSCVECFEFEPDKPGIYHVHIWRQKESTVPFYYREMKKYAGMFTNGARVETWLTSIEIEHLIKDGWMVEIFRGYYWEDSFNMRDMVDNLETLRSTDPDGPSGPLGLMVKAIGNNAYGKTLENLDGVEYILARECPDKFMPYDEFDKTLANVFFKYRDVTMKNYHQPQIGVFVTAHVRILVREAALKYADNFLYADTDCVVFDCPVTHLEIDGKKYGSWKEEAAGEQYLIIGKKIYCDFKPDDDKKRTRKGKGLHSKKLTIADFQSWYDGNIPAQDQLQRNNFLKFSAGGEMFREQNRSGTDVTKSKQAKLEAGFYRPR